MFYPSSTDVLNTSEKSTDVLDALLISLKETAHICNLECLEKVSFPFPLLFLTFGVVRNDFFWEDIYNSRS